MIRAWCTSRHRRWLVLDGFGNPTESIVGFGSRVCRRRETPSPPSDIATPTDVFAGSTPTVTISATTGAGDPASDFAGPVSVELIDGGGNTIFTANGNFSGGVYSFQLPALAAAGATDATYTLHVVIE